MAKAKPRPKINKQRLIESLRERKKERRNHTFRFEIELVEQFKKKCEKDSFSATEVLEELMRDYIKQ